MGGIWGAATRAAWGGGMPACKAPEELAPVAPVPEAVAPLAPAPIAPASAMLAAPPPIAPASAVLAAPASGWSTPIRQRGRGPGARGEAD